MKEISKSYHTFNIQVINIRRYNLPKSHNHSSFHHKLALSSSFREFNNHKF
ncbi:hypothetical protein F383_28072 [Gossypium arboreum]|uniref:Uncharacterized protein n=1 Tax=Gossypium arboreum TaxID=29729 RepID=A0A0B0PAT6_GOSAR|nr:hypothetical protein F383_28072 [Gossypium arboreum]